MSQIINQQINVTSQLTSITTKNNKNSTNSLELRIGDPKHYKHVRWSLAEIKMPILYQYSNIREIYM